MYKLLAMLVLIGSVPTALARTLRDIPGEIKNAHFQLIPLPIIATDPTEGQTYGAMPVVIALDPNDAIIAIAATALTWNKTNKWGGFANVIFSPSEYEELRVFGGATQRYYSEALVDYSNRRLHDGELQTNAHFWYLEYPFERFFGFGPRTAKSAESNFTSRLFRAWGEAGYEFWPDLSVVGQIDWGSIVMNPAALAMPDTSVAYAAEPEVRNADQVMYRAGLRWDSRDSQTFPTHGIMGSALGIYSHAANGIQSNFGGYELRGKFAAQPHERVTLIGNLRWQQLFGKNIPFYFQSSLGGEKELRSFTRRRFVDHHLALAEFEARINVFQKRVFGTDVGFSLDPFFSVGQVFRNFNQLKPSNLEPTGGLGIRMNAKPAVLGRIDLAYGRDGFTVYTTMDYPF